MKTGNKVGEKLYDEASLPCQLAYYKQLVHNAKLTIKNNKKILYFAGPFFTDKALEFQRCCAAIAYTSLERSAHRFTNIFFPMSVDQEEYDTPKKVYEHNIEMLEQCDELIAFVSEKDVGTAMEIGYAKALGKKVTLLVYDKSDLLSHTNLMLSFAAPCIELKDFASFLMEEPTNFIKVEDVWEGEE